MKYIVRYKLSPNDALRVEFISASSGSPVELIDSLWSFLNAFSKEGHNIHDMDIIDIKRSQ